MINLARWLFLGILIEAPWAYGSTRPWTVLLLDYLLWGCGILCLLGWLWEGHIPRLPAVPVTCLALVVLQGFWMWYNAYAYYDDSFFQFVMLTQTFPGLPGTWDKASTLFALQQLSGVAIGFVIACDLVADRLWCRRLWTTLGLTGGSIILFGLAQKALHAPSIFWLKEDTGKYFFGPYRYHANAGDFLNLIWPVLALLTVKAWREKDRHVARAFWMGLLLLALAACFANTSRGSNAITLVLLVPALLAFAPFFLTHLSATPLRITLVALALLGVFGAALALGGATHQTATRWENVEQDINGENPRLLVQQATVKTLPTAGWLGFGPGTFATIFPYFSGYLGNKLWGFWMYAHEDYLQTVLEYGCVGAAIWSLFFFGGLAKAVRGSFNRHLRTDVRLECRAAALALGAIALHSLFDFPLQVYSIQLYVAVILAAVWIRTTFPPRRDD